MSLPWTTAKFLASGTVDREAKVLRGYVVAQEGPFKSEGRGEFDVASLRKIAALGNQARGGLKARLGHPTQSDDGIGKFLGRSKNFRMDSVRLKKDGEWTLLHAVRADLFFDDSAFDTPNGDLAGYVLRRAESDPESLSSSLVLKADEVQQLDPKTKKPLLNPDGSPKPPLWTPVRLHASDIVDIGDAVDGLLSHGINIDGLPDEMARRGLEMLRTQFAGKSRKFAEQHLRMWMFRALNAIYGELAMGGGPMYDIGDMVNVMGEDGTSSQGQVRSASLGYYYDVMGADGAMMEDVCEDDMMPIDEESDGGGMMSALGVVTGEPPNGSGDAVEGQWSKPTLADFTDQGWGDLTDREKLAITKYFAWYSDLNDFGSLKLPHHFPPNHANAGKASADGVRNALARLNQVQGIPAGDKQRIRSHLQNHLPSQQNGMSADVAKAHLMIAERGHNAN